MLIIIHSMFCFHVPVFVFSLMFVRFSSCYPSFVLGVCISTLVVLHNDLQSGACFNPCMLGMHVRQAMGTFHLRSGFYILIA